MQHETIENIQVLIRVRPFIERERLQEAQHCFRIDEQSKNTIIFDATTKNDARYFTFDHICPQQVSQEEIFRIIGIPTARSCLQGYNGCIFAYGQTGAGKTFTIQGSGLESNGSQSPPAKGRDRVGLLPRVVEYMFSDIESEHDTSSSTAYEVRCSYLEIYNEQIIDLLNPFSKNLQLREDIRKGVYVEGLMEEVCHNAWDTLEIVRKGNRSRHTGATNMNIESSRSHSVFTLTIEGKITKDGVTNINTSRFSFVDLAGSERQKASGTVGERLKEGCLINKSLMVLANVINSLVDISEGKSRFVHYRDSKLTFLLKDSLGGNARTSIIANISPASTSFGETISTLKFAQRAKLIKTRIRLNTNTTGTLEGLRSEIIRLRQELASLKNLLAENVPRPIKSEVRRCNSQIELGHANDNSPADNSWQLEESEPRDSVKNQELEILLKQSLDILTEGETRLLNELHKKDEIIEKLKTEFRGPEKDELQKKMMIKLLFDKSERFKQLLAQKVLTKEDCIEIIQGESDAASLREQVLEALEGRNLTRTKTLGNLQSSETKEKQRKSHHIEIASLRDNELNKYSDDSPLFRHVNERKSLGFEESSLQSSPSKQKSPKKIESNKENYANLFKEYEKLSTLLEVRDEEISRLKEEIEQVEIEKKAISQDLHKRLSQICSDNGIPSTNSHNIENVLKEIEKQAQNARKLEVDVKVSKILEEELPVYKKKLEEAQNAYKAFEKELLSKQDECANLKITDMNRKKEYEEIKRLYASVQEDYQSREHEIETIRKDLKHFQETCGNQKFELDQLQTTYEQVLTDSQNKDKEIEDLKKLCETLKTQQVDSEQSTSQRLEELTCNNKRLQQDLVTEQKRYDTLELANTQKDEQLVKSDNEYKDLMKQYLNQSKDFAVLRNEIGSLKKSLLEKEREETSLLNKIQLLEENHRAKERAYEVLMAEKVKSDKAVESSQSAKEELKEIKDFCSLLEGERAQVQVENARHKESIKKLEESVIFYSTNFQNLELEHEQKVQVITEAKDNYVHQLKTLSQEIQQIKDQKSNELNEANNEMTLLKKNYQESFLKNEELSLKNSQLTQQIKKLTETIENTKESQNDTLFEKDEEIRSLAGQNGVLRTKCEALGNELEKIKEKKETLLKANQKYVEESRNNETEYENKIAALESEREKLKVQIKESLNNENKIAVLEAEREKLKVKIQKSLEESQNNEMEYQNKIVILEADKEELKVQIQQEKQSIEGKCNNLTEEVQSLKLAEQERKLVEAIQIKQIKELNKKREELDKVNQESKNELRLKDLQINEMMKEYEELVQEKEKLVKEIANSKSLETRLKQEIQEYSAKILIIYEDQEREIKEIKERYSVYENTQKNVEKTLKDKETTNSVLKQNYEKLLSENQKITQDMKRTQESSEKILSENQKIVQEMKKVQENEKKTHQKNEELIEKIDKMSDDQHLLLKQVDNINKITGSSTTNNGYSSINQKIQNLNSFQEKYNKLLGEKTQMSKKLTLSQEQIDILQKKIEHMNLEKAKNQRNFVYSRQDVERKTIQDFNSLDNMTKINSIIYSNLTKENPNFSVPRNSDIDSALRGLQFLSVLIMEKNNMIKTKEEELESILLVNKNLENQLGKLGHLKPPKIASLTNIDQAVSTDFTPCESLNSSALKISSSNIKNKSRANTPKRNVIIPEVCERVVRISAPNSVARSSSKKRAEAKEANAEEYDLLPLKYMHLKKDSPRKK